MRNLDQKFQNLLVLKAQGTNKGDRVIIYMPMIPKQWLQCLHVPELEQFTLLYLVVLQ